MGEGLSHEVKVIHIYVNVSKVMLCLISAKKKKKGDEDGETADSESSQRSETEEILDSILPPREWEEGGQLWRQSVSSTPATRFVCRKPLMLSKRYF